MKRFLKLGTPNSGAIRAGLANIHYHLEYIAWLCDRRRWLAGDAFSRADIVAAAEPSAVDYIGDIPLVHPGRAKARSARATSRPRLRALPADQILGETGK